ncbi:LysM peptidoglycan-binding domain-containing protein [Ureibacillus sp. GCM10028918]|uniref:LysM peptidoglycan-binding domain-containing protein n=1 Tax=Ureibacillus sp. GCM10028918 TaxID=3273429 RepID=UPI0036089CB2
MRIHIVQKGETLWRIAKQYGIGLDELKRLNTHLANPDYIVPGMEIFLPENGAASPKSTMTKEQQTAPMPTKEMMTAPKEKLTQPIEKPKPVKEVPKVVETAPIPAPVPQPMPMPQVDLMPQFQFDFAPQMHFQQPKTLPAPAPAPAPVPQPIYIQMPAPQTQVETNVETSVEKEVQYVHVPVPQPQIIYVCCPPPQPCGCHEQTYHHNPCGCHEQVHHHNPCGCHEQVYYHNPCGCQEQQYYQPQPCGCDDHANYQQMPYAENEYDYQQMPQQYNDCGCGGGYPSQEMMPYGMPNFEPNYDMAPMSDVAPAMEGYDEDHDGLPDWLLDSSEMKTKMVDQDFDPNAGHQNFEEYSPFDGVEDQGQAANYYQEGYNYGNGANPYNQNFYGPYDMQQGMPGPMRQMMPQQMMPQQMMQPNQQGYPNNPYIAQNRPWNY